MKRGTTGSDSIDRVVEEWGAVRPELDITPSAVVLRIAALAHAYGIEIGRFFAARGLTRADFEVLATLRRTGGYLAQHEIVGRSKRSSGTVSFRIDKLERDGLVRRAPDATDARSTIVSLTARGRRIVDDLAPAHLENERRLLSALSGGEQRELAVLLRKLLAAREP